MSPKEKYIRAVNITLSEQHIEDFDEPINSDCQVEDYHDFHDSDQIMSDNDRIFDDLGLLSLKTIKISKGNTENTVVCCDCRFKPHVQEH